MYKYICMLFTMAGTANEVEPLNYICVHMYTPTTKTTALVRTREGINSKSIVIDPPHTNMLLSTLTVLICIGTHKPCLRLNMFAAHVFVVNKKTTYLFANVCFSKKQVLELWCVCVCFYLLLENPNGPGMPNHWEIAFSFEPPNISDW